MDAEFSFSEAELLDIHAVAEQLDLRCRVWNFREAIALSAAVVACVVTAAGGIASANYGSSGPGYNTYDRIWFGGLIGILIAGSVAFCLHVVQSLFVRRLEKHCQSNNVLQEKPFPPPQEGELFGRDRVIQITPGELSVVSPRYAGAEGIWRMLCFIILAGIALVTTIASVVNSYWPGLICGIVSAIFTAALGWTVIPLSMQWIVTTKERTPFLIVRTIRWILWRGLVEISPQELKAFYLNDGELVMEYSEQQRLRVAYLGNGTAAQWKARRLVAAICDRLGLPLMDIALFERRRTAGWHKRPI